MSTLYHPNYKSLKVHTTSYSDHSFLQRKFTRKKLHLAAGAAAVVVAAAAGATESILTDTVLQREQDQLRTAERQNAKGSEQKVTDNVDDTMLLRTNHRSNHDNGDTGKIVLLLDHIDDVAVDAVVQHESGQQSYTTVRPISAEVLNTDQSSFIPYFEGFSDVFFPSIRSPQVFQLVNEDFARAVPIISSQRNREQLKQNCSMLLDSGYLPTGAETFAGEWSSLPEVEFLFLENVPNFSTQFPT